MPGALSSGRVRTVESGLVACNQQLAKIVSLFMFYCGLLESRGLHRFSPLMLRKFGQIVLFVGSLLWVSFGVPSRVNAQNTQPTNPVPQVPAADAPATNTPAQASTEGTPSAVDDSTDSDVLTLFPHSQTSRYWISGQANVILQWHDSFPAAYSGKNSFF